MKKLIAILMAVLMLACIATVCFADMGLADGDSPVAETVEPTDAPVPGLPIDTGLTSPDTGI